MKTKVWQTGSTLIVPIMAAAGLAVLAGCSSHARAPSKSGFLSHYHNMTKVDDTTWRYVNKNRLNLYTKFHISDVQVVAKEYNGEPLSDEAKDRIRSYLQDAVSKALVDKYPIVTTPGMDVGELRLALTDAYKTGTRVGLTVEGEIMDSLSTYQAAAVMRTELGESYVGSWWDAPSAKQIIDAWAARLRQAIDDARSS